MATSDGSEFEVVLAAHTDELGLLIDGVDGDGVLEYTMLAPLQGDFPGQRVRVGPDGVLGVVGPRPRHYMSDEEKETLARDLRIDVGARGREAAADLHVEPGDFAIRDRDVERLAGDRITGRALDDSLLLAVLLAVASEADVEPSVHHVATVQEEVGLRGARAAGYAVDPDVGVALEVFPVDE